jgi:hypothetical protein
MESPTMKNPMMISAAVDDAGLSTSEFRVLAHVCRRAGDGECWASLPNIAKACRINEKTARASVRSLQQKGWVSIDSRGGMTHKIRPLTPTNPIPYPKEYPTQSDTPHPYQSDTPHPYQSDTDEVNPLSKPTKETHGRFSLPFCSTIFEQAWKDWQSHYKQKTKKNITPTSAKRSLNKLATMSEQDAIEAINHSIERNWTGIFPPKKETSLLERPTQQFFNRQFD